MKNASNQIVGQSLFRTAPIGAGGFIIGLDISSDGTRMVHCTDVFNGYIRNSGEKAWKLALRPDTYAESEYKPKPVTVSTDSGMFAMRIAPSNKDRMYCSNNGFIYRTDNGGALWTRTALPAKLMQSNMRAQRRFNRTIDVHPTNPDIVIISTNGDGVYYSTNAGAAWTEITFPAPGLTDGSPSKYLLAFDPTQPNNVYVHVQGSGIHRSTTGVTGTFTLIAGTPLDISNLVTTPNGDVWFCQFRVGSTYPANPLHKMTRAGAFTSWSQVTLGCYADQVAINPADQSQIVIVDEDGNTRTSRNGGSTWMNHVRRRGQGETAWLSNNTKPYYPAQIMFDPVVANRLWMAEGVGISYIDLPLTAGDDFVLKDFSNGNEELVSTVSFSHPTNPIPILLNWDKPIWRLTDDKRWLNNWNYPLDVGEPFNLGTVTIGHQIDYAIDDTNFLAAVVGQFSNQSGYTTDYGLTWRKFDFNAMPEDARNTGGCIAVSNKNNMVLLPANNGKGIYTTDGGVTWSYVSFGGKASIGGWNNAYYVNRKNVASDKTRAGVFACVVNNIDKIEGVDVLGRDIAGLWLSTNGGATWTQKFAGVINAGTEVNVDMRQYWQAKLEYVPGFSQNLVYTGNCEPNSTGDKLLWSQDDGATWTDLRASVRAVRSFGFGKAAPGQTRPAVFFYGRVNGLMGAYVSYDWFATEPTLIEEYPNASLCEVGNINGDMHKFGRCYVATSGNGFSLADYGKKFTLT